MTLPIRAVHGWGLYTPRTSRWIWTMDFGEDSRQGLEEWRRETEDADAAN